MSKCQKEIYKLARDLLQLYVRRANLVGYAFPTDTDWQQEMEDSFPYQLTPDQVKAVQDVKQELSTIFRIEASKFYPAKFMAVLVFLKLRRSL